MSVAIDLFHIYKLVDPRDNLPFYVGYTYDMEKRLREHLATAYLANSAKEQRILELKSLGLCPTMEEIETVKGTTEEAMQHELYWIYALKAQGISLTNVTSTSDRSRHTLYLDKTLVTLVDKAYKDAAHELYPQEIDKADYLEACLKFALAHPDQVKIMLCDRYSQ